MPKSHAMFKSWVVLICASLFVFYEFLQMTVFNSIGQILMQSFHISAQQFGVLAASYFYANVVFLLPAGLALDRFSTRKLILGGLGLAIVGTILMASANSFYSALLARFLIGMSSTLCFLSAARLALQWFPARSLALAIGAVATMAMLGGFIAQTPMALLVGAVGWRTALLMNALLGIVFLAIIFKTVENFPPHYQLEYERRAAQLAALGFWQSLTKSLHNSQNWFSGLYTACLSISVFIIGSSFGNLYLMQVHHFTLTQASFCSSMVFVGTILGSPTLGNLSDRLGLRRKPMLIGAFISLVLALAFLFLYQPEPVVVALLIFALGFFTSSQIIIYPLIAESNTAELSSTATSIASVLIMSSGAIFQSLFGWLLNLHWDHHTIDGVAQYSTQNFHHAMLILPVTAFISLLAASFLKETYCKSM